ncbi:MAG: hypothetical protein RR007_02245 [Kiritimatiellia bacterium]
MRLTILGAMIAGASVYGLAQDDDLDALLGGLADESAIEQADTPEKAAAPAADADPAVEPAVEEPKAEDVAAEEPSAEEDTPAVEEPVADDPVADADPAEEPVAEESKAEEIAEDESATPAPEADTPAVEEPAAEEEPATPTPEADTPAEEKPAVAGSDESAPLIGDAKVEDVLGEDERMQNELDTLELLRQKGLDIHAYACLDTARKLMTTPPPAGKAFDQYKEAIKMYSDAQRFFRQRDENIPAQDECRKGIREAKYRQATALFLDKEYKKALDLAQQVAKEGHEFGAQLVKEIEEAMNKPIEIVPEPKLPTYATDEYKALRVEINDRMKRATTYFHVGNYDAARQQIELILRADPDNESAINLRARIGRWTAARSNELKLATHDVLIDQVNKNWTPRGHLGADSEELYAPKVSTSGQRPVVDGGKVEEQKILAKLNYIRLPEFSIRPPSTLADAVDLFSNMAKTYDKPELAPEDKGVSFVLSMGNAKPAATEESADPFATPGATASGLPPIQNISMNWVTLKEALDMVCEVTGSKYVVKNKTVMIVPANYVDGKMETRSYNVMSSFVEKVGQMSGEIASGSSASDAWSTTSTTEASTGGTSDSESWKKLFTDLGVSFEGKASIVYLPSIGKLRVTNTPENLALFENILEELNVTPYQIEVEARFVEVSQNDLNSLGFEWQLNQDISGTVGSGIDWTSQKILGNTHGGESAGGIGAGGRPVFRNGATGGTGSDNVVIHGGALNQGMRFLGDGAADASRINLGNSALAPNDQFATFSAVFGKVDMTMILHMLAQRTDTDMLSSPKVLARPGQEALIRVVTEWIYPTEFDVTELEEADTNNDNNNAVIGGGGIQVTPPPVKFAVEPQSFEKTDVGVTLQVVPEVSQEGQMINLLVNPKVVEYLGDFEYGMKVPYVDYSVGLLGVTGAQIAYYQVSMPQPKFHYREISTYLSVYNGSTVVMGGLITEKRNSFEDKVPILGDLPFVGFLFRSKGEFSEKRNLLIFLTARLVDPAGRPLKTATDGRTGTAAIDAGTESSTTMGATAATPTAN